MEEGVLKKIGKFINLSTKQVISIIYGKKLGVHILFKYYST